MAGPFRDEEAGAKARIVELEAEHQRLEAELNELRENDDHESTSKGEKLAIRLRDLRGERFRLQRAASMPPETKVMALAAMGLLLGLVAIIFVTILLKNK